MTTRRQRCKREAFFLELVKDELHFLSQELADLKSLVVQSFLPPVAPPLFESTVQCQKHDLLERSQGIGDIVVSRDALLSVRSLSDSNVSHRMNLPKAIPFNDFPENYKTPSCSQIDWDSMHLMVDSVLDKSATAVDEYDEISDFVRTQCMDATTDEDEVFNSTSATATPECKPSSHKDIAVRIRCAQREAWHRVRSCGNKLSVGTLNLFTSKHDRKVEPGDSVQAANHDSLEKHFAQLRQSISDPGCISEFSNVLQSMDLGSETSDETNLQQQVTNDEDDVALRKLDCLIDPIMVAMVKLPQEKRTSFVYKALIGLCQRHKIQESVTECAMRALEKKLGVTRLDALPFSCQACGASFDKKLEICDECGDNDIFNMKEYLESDEYRYNRKLYYCEYSSDEDTYESV